MRHLVCISALGVMAAMAFGQAPSGETKPAPATKSWNQPKTPWGDPDLQGTWTGDDCIGTPLQRPVKFGDRLYLTEQELAEREANREKTEHSDLEQVVAPGQAATIGGPEHWMERSRRPCKQTSLIVDPRDGRLPDILPEAKTRHVGAGAIVSDPKADSWEDFDYYIRCITRGVVGSILPVIYGNGQQIVQGKGFVTILQEMVHEARVIPLDGRPHAGPNIRSFMGDARGHWEGNTLVVETTNFVGNTTGVNGNGGGTPTSDALTLTERYTRTGPNEMRYELTVDDPKTFVRPYKVLLPLTEEPGYRNYEYACHEGNYGMFNSLSGARAKEKKAAAAAAAAKN